MHERPLTTKSGHSRSEQPGTGKPALEAVFQGNSLILKRPLEQLVGEGPTQGCVARFLRNTVILHGLCGPVDYQLNAIASTGGRLALDDDHVFRPRFDRPFVSMQEHRTITTKVR